MKHRTRYANITSTVALVVALVGGGTAVAANLAKDSVASRQIKNGTVKAVDIKSGAVGSAQVGDDRLTGADIDEGSLRRVRSAESAVTAESAGFADRAIHADIADNILVAAVNENGTPATGSLNFGGSVRLNPGSYKVTFSRNVNNCAISSSLARHTVGNSVQGSVSTAEFAGDPASVFVTTVDTSGVTTVDRSFTVLVVCGF